MCLDGSSCHSSKHNYGLLIVHCCPLKGPDRYPDREKSPDWEISPEWSPQRAALKQVVILCWRHTSTFIYSGCNIGCKKSFPERGKLPLKLTCPCRHFHLPGHSGQQRWGWTFLKLLLAERGKSGSCPACPIAVCWWYSLATCNGATLLLYTVLLFLQFNLILRTLVIAWVVLSDGLVSNTIVVWHSAINLDL